MATQTSHETYSDREFYNAEAISTLEEWLSYGDRFVAPPEVGLVAATQSTEDKNLTTEDFGVSTAKQCYYSGSGVLKIRETEADRNIAVSTLEAGHHTTRLHTSFTYRLIGISRQAIWRVFHSHPFYNSEQQSQRYAELNVGGVLVPVFENPNKTELFLSATNEMNSFYQQLLELSSAQALRKMENGKIYNAQERSNKIGQEVARYVLPIGQKSNMFHTLSHLQILRLFRSGNMESFTDEDRYIIAKMITEIHDFEINSGQIGEGTVNQSQRSILASLQPPLRKAELPQREVFESLRGHDFSGYEFGSTLIGDYATVERLLAQSIRIGTGLEGPDEQLVGLALDPRTNPLIADIYDAGIHDPLTRAIRSIGISFVTKLSHTADSQRQRHRRTPGSVEPMNFSYHGPDYHVPMLVREERQLAKTYQTMMSGAYGHYEQALELGMPVEYANLLLPNGHGVVNLETGDLYDVLHKLRQRLCYLAQEEIGQIMEQQAVILRHIIPQLDAALGAPCAIRDLIGIGPKCPEGDKYCGIPVWNLDLEDYYTSRVV